MALVVSNGSPGGGNKQLLLLQNGNHVGGVGECDKLRLVTPSSSKYCPTLAKTRMTAEKAGCRATDNDQVSFLVEIVKAAIPKSPAGSDADKSRGMHCTARWIGPMNPTGRKRLDKVLHRTKTLKKIHPKIADVDAMTASALAITSSGSSDSDDGGDEEVEVDCAERVFTLNDDSLFLFETSMRQLVNASVDSPPSSEDTSSGDASAANGIFNNGGLRIDVFDEPLDIFNAAFSSVLGNNIAMMEANAVTRESSSLLAGYRLVGSAFLTPEEILSRCDERRFGVDLVENWRKIHQQHGSTVQRMTPKKVEGGSVVLRIRPASEFDVSFMRALEENRTSSNTLQTILIRSANGNKHLKPAQITTEMDESLLTAQCSVKAITSISPIATEGVRYLFSNDTEKRVYVKPYADPNRPEDTTWFTEEGLHNECYKPSTNWIQAGQEGDTSLGRVYLEVLECRGLPNTDAGGAIGNKTDAFVSIVYGNIMVQTEVIDDSCSPMWMPWCSRAFVFQMVHPSTAIYIGVADYDFGPLEHECIGRVAIDMEKFFPGTLYTVTYNLHESSNLTEKGEDEGTITVRLRVEVPDEKKYLMKGWKAPETSWVNSQQWKSHRIAKFCVDGPHDEDVFEMSLFRSHINELLTQKRYLSYAISDSVRSLIFWRGQVKVGNVWLPLHSAVVFYFSVHVVERPQLVPSFLLFGCGWIMIVNMLQRENQPNPWRRGHSFAHYWNVLTQGESFHAAGKAIRPNHGHKEASKLEAKWKQRLADADAEYAKQAELDAKIKTISEDTIIRTKAKASGVLEDPISAMAGAKLLPYQQRLAGYCNKVRYIRNVMNWNESIISFFITLVLFGSAVAALFIPWGFLLRWTSRLVVWGCLGPWMRILDLFFHEEAECQQTKASKKTMKLFHEQRKTAKLLREQALKMKAFRVKLFGQFITRLPEFNLTRHEDIPLPSSYAEPYLSVEEIQAAKFVPSQDLSGPMIPMTGQDPIENEARKQKAKECLMGRYETTKEKKSQPSSASVDDYVDEGFELVDTEDRVICVHSTSEGTDGTEERVKFATTHTRSESVRDVSISDKAIQSALEKELQELTATTKTCKTKWIFSANVSVSLRKETVEDVMPAAPAICNGADNELVEQTGIKGLIEQMDDIQEEGVEVVPFLASDHNSTAESVTSFKQENDSHVSVLYLKDDARRDDARQAMTDFVETEDCEHETRDDDNVTANAVKKIRFRSSISEID